MPESFNFDLSISHSRFFRRPSAITPRYSQKWGRSPTQILGRLNEFARPFGINFGSRALSEIVRHFQEHPALKSQPALIGYRTALTFFLRKRLYFQALQAGELILKGNSDGINITRSERSNVVVHATEARLEFQIKHRIAK